jgi:hypothetical protein
MVDANGKKSNRDLLEELARICSILEEITALSRDCNLFLC